jgi:hypothetical protein
MISFMHMQKATLKFKVWLQLFFKVFLVLKYIKIIFFYILKIIYEISALKRSKTQKKILIFSKTKKINF